jgi:hypothetical protein
MNYLLSLLPFVFELSFYRDGDTEISKARVLAFSRTSAITKLVCSLNAR